MPESAEVSRAAQDGMMRPIDVAAYLGVSRQRVDQLEALDRLPGTRLVAGHRMWDSTEIEALADQCWWSSKPWRARSGQTEPFSTRGRTHP